MGSSQALKQRMRWFSPSALLTRGDPNAPHPHGESWHSPRGRAIREVIFGINDGIISTLGFLAGVSQSISEGRTILLAGVAAAVAGSASMGLGAYVAAKSQRAFFAAEIAREKWEIDNVPEREIEEIREIYGSLGFTPAELDVIVRRITSNPSLWLRFMKREELGLTEEQFDPPLRSGLLTAAAFTAGSLPLLVPYLALAPAGAFPAAAAIAAVALLTTGAAKTWLTKESVLRASLEMAGLGAIAAGIGLVLGKLVGIAI